jgi:hypothetical protein
MALGDRIIIGVTPGVLYPQPDPVFTETGRGEFDEGQRVYLTHPRTAKTRWPQRGQADSALTRGVHPNMYVDEVTDREDESGLIELTVSLRGVLKANGNKPTKQPRKTPGSDTQIFTIPAPEDTTLPSGARVATYVLPMPEHTFLYQYCQLTKPSFAGVGTLVSSTNILPEPAPFVLSFVPDPAQPLTLNYRIGWWFTARTWTDIEDRVWLVSDQFRYYNQLA